MFHLLFCRDRELTAILYIGKTLENYTNLEILGSQNMEETTCKKSTSELLASTLVWERDILMSLESLVSE